MSPPDAMVAELRRPLTEIEKAELSEACRVGLTPVGMLLLRRLLHHDSQVTAERDALRKALERIAELRRGEDAEQSAHALLRQCGDLARIALGEPR